MRRTGAAGYGNELRQQIVAALDEGATLKEVAQRYQVGLDTVRVYREKAQQGTLTQRVKPTGRSRTVQAEHEQQLLRQLEAHPGATLQQHADMLHDALGLRISYRTVDRVFQRHGVTRPGQLGRRREE